MNTPTIDEMLEIFIDKKSDSKDSEFKEKLKEMFLDDIKKEIIFLEKDRILSDTQKEKERLINDGLIERQRIIDDGNKEVEKSKAVYAIDKAQSLFRDGIIVAFIIGILVNQCTDLITPLKELISKSSKINIVIITFIIVVAMFFIINNIIKIHYFDKIKDYIFNKGNQEEM